MLGDLWVHDTIFRSQNIRLEFLSLKIFSYLFARPGAIHACFCFRESAQVNVRGCLCLCDPTAALTGCLLQVSWQERSTTTSLTKYLASRQHSGLGRCALGYLNSLPIHMGCASLQMPSGNVRDCHCLLTSAGKFSPWQEAGTRRLWHCLSGRPHR